MFLNELDMAEAELASASRAQLPPPAPRETSAWAPPSPSR